MQCAKFKLHKIIKTTTLTEISGEAHSVCGSIIFIDYEVPSRGADSASVVLTKHKHICIKCVISSVEPHSLQTERAWSGRPTVNPFLTARDF